jgi:hypothetical protein
MPEWRKRIVFGRTGDNSNQPGGFDVAAQDHLRNKLKTDDL